MTLARMEDGSVVVQNAIALGEKQMKRIEAMGRAHDRKIQPFVQVPAVEIGDTARFESGAIVLHTAEQSEALLPRTPRCARTCSDGCSPR